MHHTHSTDRLPVLPRPPYYSDGRGTKSFLVLASGQLQASPLASASHSKVSGGPQHFPGPVLLTSSGTRWAHTHTHCHHHHPHPPHPNMRSCHFQSTCNAFPFQDTLTPFLPQTILLGLLEGSPWPLCQLSWASLYRQPSPLCFFWELQGNFLGCVGFWQDPHSRQEATLSCLPTPKTEKANRS